MTRNKIKYLIYTVLLISLCAYIIPKTYAVTAALPYVNPNHGSGNTYQKPRYETNEYITPDLHHQYYCTYNDNLALLRTVSVNAYDSEGRTIIPFFPISLVDFKSGTAIGTNVQETKKAAWDISGRKIYEHLYTKKVTYEYIGCPICETAKKCEEAAAAKAKCAEAQAQCTSLAQGLAEGLGAAGINPGNIPNLGGLSCDNIAACANIPTVPEGTNCEAAIEECEACEKGCKEETKGEDAYCYAFGSYNQPTAVVEICKPTKGYTMDFKSQDEDVLGEWFECCPKTYDTCHDTGESNIANGEPSIFPFRAAEQNKELNEAKGVLKDAVKLCTQYAAQDTSDKRAIPFIATPTIEIQIFEPNEYNKKNEKDESKIELKTFSGYKVLLDKNLNAKEKLLQTKKISHYVNSYDNKYKSEDVSYFLEDFYSYEQLHVKEIDDPQQLKTNLPEVNYVPKEKDEYHVSYEYSPDKVCIDVRTSDVYYDTTDTKNGHNEPPKQECTDLQKSNNKKDDIKEVPNKITQDEYLNQKDVEYWHYFIPLDTKTTNSDGNDFGFFISVTDKRTAPMKWDYCISILEYMKENQDAGLLSYTDILLPIKDNVSVGFEGDYDKDYELFSEQKYGCLFSLKVKFNIKQKFYGEVTDDNKLKIKGYGFYYKPINVNEPFPNSLANDSLWKNLYSSLNNTIIVKDENGNETTIDLNSAFANITYTTKDVSSDPALINDLRVDTVNGEVYTSFKDVNIKNGQSPFVEKYNLRRNVDLSSLYKLGCGPDNLNWEGCN